MPLRLLRHPLGGGFSAAAVFAALHGDESDVFWLDSGAATARATSAAASAGCRRLRYWMRVRAELAGPAPMADDDAPPFRLGLVGWFGYELRGETMGVPVARASRYPDAAFLRVDRAVGDRTPTARAELLALGDAWEGELADVADGARPRRRERRGAVSRRGLEPRR